MGFQAWRIVGISDLRRRVRTSQPQSQSAKAMKYSLRSLIKFSIRDLILVTVIVAILSAWWVDHRRQAAELRHLHFQMGVESRSRAIEKNLGGDF